MPAPKVLGHQRAASPAGQATPQASRKAVQSRGGTGAGKLSCCTHPPSGHGSAAPHSAPLAQQAEGAAQAVATLKEAARTRAVPRDQVFAALQALEQAGPGEQDWEATVAQPSPSGADDEGVTPGPCRVLRPC